ncbi:MAG: prepilin-type N-terminal cleavage/methylation domain-containing protein [Tepidisphaeraceae bacterium]
MEFRFPATNRLESIQRTSRRNRGGFTLLEALIAAVVLSILVLGVCGVLSQSYEQTQAAQSNSIGVMLAAQLADEIAAKPMADPLSGSTTLGPDPGMTSRSTFTRVTNYNGYTDTSTSLPLLGGGSLDVTGSDAYTRSVDVVVGARPSIDTLSPAANFAIVTVNVTYPDGDSVSIPRFVANYSIQR